MKRTLLLVCMALAGCHGGFNAQWGPPFDAGWRPAAAAKADTPAEAVAGAIVIGVMTEDGLKYYTRLPDGTTTPYYGTPQPDPNRRINVQDCTQPIDVHAGNLMCK